MRTIVGPGRPSVKAPNWRGFKLASQGSIFAVIAAITLGGTPANRDTEAIFQQSRVRRFQSAGAPVLVAYVFVVMPFPVIGGGNFPIEALVLHLARVLPDNLWMLVAMALAAMAGLYWLAEKLWRDNELRHSELTARASKEARVN